MNKEFYQRTKNKINKKTFTNGSYERYQTLVKAYEEYPEIESLDMDTLRTLHFDKYNPMITTANKRNVEDLIDIVGSQEVPSGKAIEDNPEHPHFFVKDPEEEALDIKNPRNKELIKQFREDARTMKVSEFNAKYPSKKISK